MTISDDQFSGWTKRKLQSTSQSQTCTKKGLGHLFIWWSAAHLIRYSFLNPGKIIISEKYAQQIDEIHQNCNTCSWPPSTERVQFFFLTMPDRTSHR